MANGEWNTYAPKKTVRARRVMKGSEELVTTNGRVIAGQNSYVIESTSIDPFTGAETTQTAVMENSEFNDQYVKTTDHAAEIKAAREDGYSDGFDDGWTKCTDAKGTADTVVTDSDESTQAGRTESDDTPILPPVGDQLETSGPASKNA